MLDSRLEELRKATLAAFASAGSTQELEEARVAALGRGLGGNVGFGVLKFLRRCRQSNSKSDQKQRSQHALIHRATPYYQYLYFGMKLAKRPAFGGVPAQHDSHDARFRALPTIQIDATM